MMLRIFQHGLVGAAILTFSVACVGDDPGKDSEWQKDFDLSSCNLVNTGKNQYFILEPGYQLVLQKDEETLQITVLNDTKMVDGVLTRVVEEREWDEEEVVEVSRNYFAICEQTKDVFYFGEDVDNYKDGKVDNHDGSWLAGEGENKPGLFMPGTPQEKMKFYTEVAPGVAMDRAEIVSLKETCKTPAGTFASCMKVQEGTALNYLEKEYKYHAPGVGLIQDESLVLIKYGMTQP